MARGVLSDSEWERFRNFLPGKASDRGGTARDSRPFMAAVLRIAGTGSPRRDLPKAFGQRHRVYVRYSRWGKNGTWANLSASAPDRPDLDQLMVDGSLSDGGRQHCQGASARRS
jgi:transposase